MQNQQPHNSLTLQLKRPLADNGNRKRQQDANRKKPLVFSVNRKRLHVANESKKRLQDANRKRPHVFNVSRKRPLVFSVSKKRLLPASVLISNSSNPISNRLISSRLTSSLTTRLAHKAQACPPFRHSHQHQEAVPTSP